MSNAPPQSARLVLVLGEGMKDRVVKRAHMEFTSASEWARSVIAKALAEPNEPFTKHTRHPVEHRAA